jgi:hypothetical protein
LKLDRHCEERSDAAIQFHVRDSGLPRFARNDDLNSPNALAVAETLTRWSKIKSTFQHVEFSKNFSGELGTSAAQAIVSLLKWLCLIGLAWLVVVQGT